MNPFMKLILLSGSKVLLEISRDDGPGRDGCRVVFQFKASRLRILGISPFGEGQGDGVGSGRYGLRI